jgi:hypothetical protein
MPSSTVGLAGLGLVLLSGFMGLFGSATRMEMADELNRTLPPERQFGSKLWGPLSYWAAIREYSRRTPGGPLCRRAQVLTALQLGSLVAAVACWEPLWFVLPLGLIAVAAWVVDYMMEFRT